MAGLPPWLLIFPVLTFLIFIHELGHFATAKWFGIEVTEFGFGFPPRMFGIRYRGTIYSINWIPLGGFVRMVGEEDPTNPSSFARQSIPKRSVVLVAGSFMNLLLPVVIFTILFMLPHATLVGGDISIIGVVPGSPAHEAGLRPGDTIIAINGYNVVSRLESMDRLRGMVDRINASRGKPTTLTVRRGGTRAGIDSSPDLVSIETVTIVPRAEDPPALTVVDVVTDPTAVMVSIPSNFGLTRNPDGTFRYQPGEGNEAKVGETQISLAAARSYDPDLKPGGQLRQRAIGVSLTFVGARVDNTTQPVWEALPASVQTIWEDVILFTLREIGRGVSTRSNPGISGPIGIAQATDEAVSALGIATIFTLTAVLSVSLGVLNIMPIPALDGGRLVFVIIEWVRRGKRISPRREGLVHLAGFVFVIGLLLVLSYADILRLIRGESFF